jgi:regulator of replication initiation timing
VELKEHHQTLLEENKTLQSAGCIANENTTLIESLSEWVTCDNSVNDPSTLIDNQLTSQKESIDKLSQQISTQNAYLHKLISSLEASQK